LNKDTLWKLIDLSFTPKRLTIQNEVAMSILLLQSIKTAIIIIGKKIIVSETYTLYSTLM
jgi:hypothetical protein